MKTRPNAQKQTHLDPKFKKWATVQTRLFLFVGHDSEAATIIYSIFLLSKNPDALAKVHMEHETVFGSDVSAYDELMEHPENINQLPYTYAVIKEILRLYPPANGLRGGQTGVSLHDEHGRSFPTEGVNIWIIHTAVQRNPAFCPKPHDFIPERWLVEKDHPLYPQLEVGDDLSMGPDSVLVRTSRSWISKLRLSWFYASLISMMRMLSMMP
ncbi:hypothetical protein N7513_008714 [Penicillium frequentans]|nr:hypothetical protein N7513_008714 [Penicillium glabrum]